MKDIEASSWASVDQHFENRLLFGVIGFVPAVLTWQTPLGVVPLSFIDPTWPV